MSKRRLTRWTDGSMTSAVAQALCRRAPLPRCSGFVAVGLSVAFLAFLLITMAAKGLGGFTQHRGRG